jgi:hypothetical protein
MRQCCGAQRDDLSGVSFSTQCQLQAELIVFKILCNIALNFNRQLKIHFNNAKNVILLGVAFGG